MKTTITKSLKVMAAICAFALNMASAQATETDELVNIAKILAPKNLSKYVNYGKTQVGADSVNAKYEISTCVRGDVVVNVTNPTMVIGSKNMLLWAGDANSADVTSDFFCRSKGFQWGQIVSQADSGRHSMVVVDANGVAQYDKHSNYVHELVCYDVKLDQCSYDTTDLSL